MTKAIYVLYEITGKIRKEVYRTESAADAYRKYDLLLTAGLLAELEPVMVDA
jgi:hypothetical protein